MRTVPTAVGGETSPGDLGPLTPGPPPLTPTRRSPRVAARLALGLFSVLLALALSEAALRILPLPDLRVLAAFQAPPGNAWKDSAWSDPPDRAFRRHRVIGHEHSPGLDATVPLAEHSGGSFRFHTNNLGLRRDVDTPVEKAPELYRVLVLGDSQTDGYVDNAESFSSLLEGELAKSPGSPGGRVEVLNAGVAGYSPAQELLWYSVHGAELRPDLTIAMFYPGNDALDMLDQSKPDVDAATGRAIPPRREEFATYDSGSPLSQLRLALLARYTVQAGPLAGLWRQLGLPGRLTETAGYPTDTLVQVFRTCHGCYLQSLQQAARARREPQEMQYAISHAAAVLIRLNREVRDGGGRLLVAALPTRGQVEPALARPLQRAVAALLRLDDSDLAFEDQVAASVLGQLTAAGVPTVELQTPLSSADRSRMVETAAPAAPREGQTSGAADDGADALYYSRDWHLNPRGHRAVAAVLASRLESLGLLPGRPRDTAQSAAQGPQSDDRRGQ